MLGETSREPKSAFKNPLIYSSAAVLIAAVAVGLIMFSRWRDERSRERHAAEEHAEKQREQDRAAVEELGGKEFSILDFYASPKAIRRGAAAKLCYGVSNAKSVKLVPQTQEVWPSAANCVEVSPEKTTTYTLTIVDAAGNSKSESLDLEVR
jgi:hypothetical protein